MLSNKYFNIKLLYAASILVITTAHASPLPNYAQRFSSTSASDSTKAPLENSQQRPTVNLNAVTTTQLDDIHRKTSAIQNQLNKLNNRNRLIKFLSLVSLGQAIYIINDKDIGGIASTIKKEWNTKYQQLLNAIEAMTKGSEASKNDQKKGDVIEVNAEQNDKKE